MAIYHPGPPSDNERILDALCFYYERVTWASFDKEKQEYLRLVTEYEELVEKERS